jgi:hypothetical protein
MSVASKSPRPVITLSCQRKECSSPPEGVSTTAGDPAGADHLIPAVDVGRPAKSAAEGTEVGEPAVPPQEGVAMAMAHHVAHVVDDGGVAVITTDQG